MSKNKSDEMVAILWIGISIGAIAGGIVQLLTSSAITALFGITAMFVGGFYLLR